MSYARKRIVFDTSSLIPTCLHPHRTPAKILCQAFEVCDVYTSASAFQELEEVVLREKFEAWQSLFCRKMWLSELKRNVIFVEPTELVLDCRDPKDNKFLDICITVSADILVSSDIHLLELHPHRGTRVLQIAEFGVEI